MKKVKFFLGLFLILIIPFVSASDVAYVYDSVWKINDKIVDLFLDLGLDTEFIKCSDVSSTDFSDYDLIFVGNEWMMCASEIPINENPSVVMNGRNTKDFGLSGRRGISTMSGGVRLKDNADNFFNAYTQSKYSRRYLTLYSLSDYQSNGFVKIAESYMNSNLDLGASVVHINSGTFLTNGETANENICFFGLHETRFWTDETEKLFNECVEFVTEISICGDGVVEGGEVCDDGGNNGDYGFCDEDCSGMIDCGDGVCDAEEDCSTCANDCGVCGSVCGNNILENGEECDDGNIEDYDGCSSICKIEEEEADISVKINEFVADPDVGNEWIELYNPTDGLVDLNGWTIEDNTGSTYGSGGGDTELDGLVISALGYLVLETELDFALTNGGDIIILKNGASEIDRVTYGNYDDGNKEDNALKGEKGKSVGRLPNGVDTNADDVDFVVFDVPTKGFAN